MKQRLLTTSLFNTFDLIFTLFLVSLFGLGIEVNLLGRMMLSNPILLFITKIVVVNLFLLLLYKFRNFKLARVGSWIVFIAYGCLTLYHLVGITLLI
jgi:Ca2+/Na+ antiporter